MGDSNKKYDIEENLPGAIQGKLDINIGIPQFYGQMKHSKIKWGRVIIWFILATALGIFLFYQSDPYTATAFMDLYPKGSTYANPAFGGFAAEYKGWVYIADNPNGESGLYKANTDTNESVKLAEGNVSSINLSGGWVYYVSGEGSSASLYKLSVNGGEPELLKSDCRQAILYGCWVYGVNSADEVFKIKTSGKGYKELSSHITSLLSIRRVDIAALSINEDVLSAVQILPSGLNDRILTSLKDAVSDGEYVFATEINQDHEYTLLHKENIETSKASILTDRLYNLPFVTDEWVYVNSEDGIYRMDKDGGQLTKLSDDHYTSINQTGDWLIYRSKSSGKLIKMRMDGSEAKAFWGE